VVSGDEASLVIPAEPNGPHVVTYRATDVDGVSCADQTLTLRMDTRGPQTQGKSVSGRVRRGLSLPYLIRDNLSPQAVGVTVTIRSGGRRVKTLNLSARTVGVWQSAKWTPRARGRYTYVVAASDLAGNRQVRSVAGVVRVR
jgi:hypothetical protein